MTKSRPDTNSGPKKSSWRRRVAVLAVAASVVAGGGVAYAWWTAGGSGTGSAATGNVVGITVNQTSSITGLYPGGSAVALAGNFTNTNSGPVRVAQVTVAIQEDWSAQADSGKPACTEADVALVQPTATNAEIPSGTNQGSWGGASIRLVNAAANQDNCKNVTVPLVYTSN